jgi:hypothetical protein
MMSTEDEEKTWEVLMLAISCSAIVAKDAF